MTSSEAENIVNTAVYNNKVLPVTSNKTVDKGKENEGRISVNVLLSRDTSRDGSRDLSNEFEKSTRNKQIITTEKNTAPISLRDLI